MPPSTMMLSLYTRRSKMITAALPLTLKILRKKPQILRLKCSVCNPHNPTGRIWTEEELKKVAEIVEKYDLWIVSDEIHCDLLRGGRRHIPMAKIMPEYRKLITCMSASKTFNMAGLMHSNIIIRDPNLRDRFLNVTNCSDR